MGNFLLTGKFLLRLRSPAPNHEQKLAHLQTCPLISLPSWGGVHPGARSAERGIHAPPGFPLGLDFGKKSFVEPPPSFSLLHMAISKELTKQK